MTEPMHIMIRPLDNPASIDWWSIAAGFPAIISSSNGTAREASSALCIRNEAVGILIDQNTSLEEGVFVDFFGIPACANTRLCQDRASHGRRSYPRLRVMVRAGRQVHSQFHPPLDIIGDATDDTRRLHAVLESGDSRVSRLSGCGSIAAGKPVRKGEPVCTKILEMFVSKHLILWMLSAQVPIRAMSSSPLSRWCGLRTLRFGFHTEHQHSLGRFHPGKLVCLATSLKERYRDYRNIEINIFSCAPFRPVRDLRTGIQL